MCLHFLVHFDEGFGETGLHQHKSKLGQKAGEKRRGILTKPPRACTILLSYKTGMDSAGRTVSSAQAGRNPHLSAVRADLMFAQAQQ